MATASKELQLIPRARREFTSVIRFIDDPAEPYFETTYLELGRGVVGTGLTREDSLRDAEQLVVGLLNDILTYGGKLPKPGLSSNEPQVHSRYTIAPRPV